MARRGHVQQPEHRSTGAVPGGEEPQRVFRDKPLGHTEGANRNTSGGRLQRGDCLHRPQNRASCFSRLVRCLPAWDGPSMVPIGGKHRNQCHHRGDQCLDWLHLHIPSHFPPRVLRGLQGRGRTPDRLRGHPQPGIHRNHRIHVRRFPRSDVLHHLQTSLAGRGPAPHAGLRGHSEDAGHLIRRQLRIRRGRSRLTADRWNLDHPHDGPDVRHRLPNQVVEEDRGSPKQHSRLVRNDPIRG